MGEQLHQEMKIKPDIEIKRVYSEAQTEDGFRVLVDRVWPRGISKKQLGADLWLKDAAPSTGLRKWFGHDRDRWEEFQRRYFAELDEKPGVIGQLLDLAEKQRLTLLFAARDTKYNHAAALTTYLISAAATKQSSGQKEKIS
ncbi:uncharacterized protein YeaO (DUF488 family) [Desulfosalsimonas propionicica]|uniref:Uncharacterized protein YeaO (DUF488 family) n=1 Tax=Desulfosalsimonas propionicica TaxID=332175 RepID=A0A7W0CAN8_9BACT|nr:DUF488 family protein [Desulfosalsimonas propionicica]MBA2882174.1 uncharacterized protein YeaO (DUF488 family) [Desulfosalsimonas propionicica]